MAKNINQKMTELLEGMNESRLVSVFNDYKYDTNSCDDILYPNNAYTINELLSGRSPYDCFVEGRMTGEGYWFADKYVYLSGGDRIVSTNNVMDVIYIGELADWLEEQPPSYFRNLGLTTGEIQALFDEDDEGNEK